MRMCAQCAVAGLVLAGFAFAQQPSPQVKTQPGKTVTQAAAPTELETTLEAKVKVEWEAIKNKDKNTYGDLLADDYEGVEVDNRGERTRTQAINELADGNIYRYTLWGLKMIPLGPDAAFLIYEVTMEFPAKAAVRYSRVYISELWVKRAGQWKELHYQETHVR